MPRDLRAANDVHAVVDPVQPTVSQPVRDRVWGESETQQLRA
jgi:hypothetical protein